MEGITRSQRFSLYYQLRAVESSLEAIVETGGEVGSLTQEVIAKLREGLVQIGSGRAFEVVPEIDCEQQATDLLVVVSLMRGTLQSFLSEDEIESLSRKAAAWLGVAGKAKEVMGL